jgi:hypothetical protein
MMLLCSCVYLKLNSVAFSPHANYTMGVSTILKLHLNAVVEFMEAIAPKQLNDHYCI